MHQLRSVVLHSCKPKIRDPDVDYHGRLTQVGLVTRYTQPRLQTVKSCVTRYSLYLTLRYSSRRWLGPCDSKIRRVTVTPNTDN